MVCLGGLVVNRARRSDVTFAFLAVYVGRCCSLALARRAARDSAASSAERRAAAVRVLHDFRPEDDAGFARRPCCSRSLVALGAVVRAVQVVSHQRAALVPGALFARSFPLIDCLLPGTRYAWTGARPNRTKETGHETPAAFVATLVLCGLLLADARVAFCGFYVAKADTKLFNKASQVVLVRDGDRTVLTMANDFQGDPKEFAVVIPVPTVIEREQIHIGDKALIDHLDAYSAPRLVEYFDENPCAPDSRWRPCRQCGADAADGGVGRAERDKSLGVHSRGRLHRRRVRHLRSCRPTQSDGLETWLGRTATTSRRAPPTCSAATSGRTCGSSSRK